MNGSVCCQDIIQQGRYRSVVIQVQYARVRVRVNRFRVIDNSDLERAQPQHGTQVRDWITAPRYPDTPSTTGRYLRSIFRFGGRYGFLYLYLSCRRSSICYSCHSSSTCCCSLASSSVAPPPLLLPLRHHQSLLGFEGTGANPCNQVRFPDDWPATQEDDIACSWSNAVRVLGFFLAV